MMAKKLNDLISHIVTADRVNAKTVQKRHCGFNAGFVMRVRTPSAVEVFRRRWFSEIMRDRSKHYCHLFGIWQIVDQLSRFIGDHHRMNIYITLWVPFRLLRDADEGFQFRENLINDPKLIKPPQTDRWLMTL